MENEKCITFTVTLSEAQAWAFAQFLKRAGYSDYREKASSDDEAYLMQFAGENIRADLAASGVTPR